MCHVPHPWLSLSALGLPLALASASAVTGNTSGLGSPSGCCSNGIDDTLVAGKLAVPHVKSVRQLDQSSQLADVSK